MILAHRDINGGQEQLLITHCINVAVSARKDGETISQGDILFLLGLYHDLGKANAAFQDKLERNPNRHVDHSSAGAKYLFHAIKNCLKESSASTSEKILFRETVAYVISSHHGMYDIPLNDTDIPVESFAFNKLIHRISEGISNKPYKNDVLPFAELLEKKLSAYGYAGLDDLIKKAFDNYRLAWQKLNYKDSSEKDFYSGCFVRLYLALLKNADILDTINAYDLKLKPMSQSEREQCTNSYYSSIETLYEGFSNPTNRLNRIRTGIAARVRNRGRDDEAGIYRLDLPTGAGKTNLSMRYAFNQMYHQEKKRFVYITPFLSVLEQNAAAIRKVIGEIGVLEHHSNVVQNKREVEDNQSDERDELVTEYLIDSWDSPVVLSSMVQFFQTLFKTKSSNIRRFSSLIDSVLILDEVQSLPIEVTTLFNLSMNFLSKVMNTTIVLCTATQPVYDSDYIKHTIEYVGMNETANIVSLTSEERDVFARTELRKIDEKDAKISLSLVADFILEEEASTLVVLNTKKAVDKLYNLLEEATNRPLYYLSTNMCPKHRLDTIQMIQNQLKKDVPLICVSTQLIEAGVDLDFKRVVRSYAGIDSIVQASGRCNREGKQEKGQVTLVNLTMEEENISRLKEIRAKKDSTESILHRISSPIDISLLNHDFFENYYANNQNLMDYPLSHGESVYDYLSVNTYQRNPRFKGKLRQGFKTAGLKMNLINNDTIGVLVPYGEAIEKIFVLEELCKSDYPSAEDYQIIKSLLKELQPYSVNVREHDPILEATKSYLNSQILVLSNGYYDENKGITMEMSDFLL